ncbi:pyridoxamine 5'-phosphate oxidase family protein [Planctomycetota bacterium]|nr:pyridoxamine 5'-phosphate oxidase family protein [Planctomycetota bacterium]
MSATATTNPIDPKLKTKILDFLATWKTGSLATLTENGAPQSCNIMYVHDQDLNLYFVSGTQSAHSQAVERDPRSAITIYAHVNSALKNHGLQIQGTTRLVSDEEEYKTVLNLYAKKMAQPLVRPIIKQLMKTQPFYAFTPTWIRFCDSRVKFGFKEEHTF